MEEVGSNHVTQLLDTMAPGLELVTQRLSVDFLEAEYLPFFHILIFKSARGLCFLKEKGKDS